MTTLQELTTKILNCTENFQGFKHLYPGLLSDLFGGGKPSCKIFIDVINRIVEEKDETPINKFYALYLLLKACETSQNDDLIQAIMKKDELISYIYTISQYKQGGQVGSIENGKNFFSSNPSPQEAIIGINYVRLCLEIIIYWSKTFGRKEFLFNSKDPILIPKTFWFIGKTYQTNKEIALVDFNYENLAYIPEQTFDKNPVPQKKIFGEKMTQYGVVNDEPMHQQRHQIEHKQQQRVSNYGHHQDMSVGPSDVNKLHQGEQIHHQQVHREDVNQEQMKHLILENNELKNENSLLKEKLRELQAELKHKTDHNDKLMKENQSLQVRLSDYQQKNEGFHNTLNQLLDENYKLRELNASIQKDAESSRQNSSFNTPQFIEKEPVRVNPQFAEKEHLVRSNPQHIEKEPIRTNPQTIPTMTEQKPKWEDYHYSQNLLNQNKSNQNGSGMPRSRDNLPEDVSFESQRRIFRKVHYEKPRMVLTAKDFM